MLYVTEMILVKKKKKQDLFLTLMKLQEFSVAQRLRSFLSNSRMLQSSTKIISIIFSAAFCKESRLFTVLLLFFFVLLQNFVFSSPPSFCKLSHKGKQ